jgi:hypothetical protein
MKNINGFLKIALGACLACGVASATDLFNFTGGSPVGSGNSNSDLSSYSVSGSTGATATVYAFETTGTQTAPGNGNLIGPTSNSSTNPPVVGEYNGDGVGICQTSNGNGTVANCGSPDHQISDGNNSGTAGGTYTYEFLLIQFSTAVNLTELQLGNFGNNSLGGNPFGVTYYTSSSASSLNSIESGLEGAALGSDATFGSAHSASCSANQTQLSAGGNGGTDSYVDNCAVNGNAIETLSGTDVTYLLIGASVSGNGNDYFKLQDISANIATPEPASFGMIGLALLGLGVAGRRKFQSSKN